MKATSLSNKTSNFQQVSASMLAWGPGYLVTIHILYSTICKLCCWSLLGDPWRALLGCCNIFLPSGLDIAVCYNGQVATFASLTCMIAIALVNTKGWLIATLSWHSLNWKTRNAARDAPRLHQAEISCLQLAPVDYMRNSDKHYSWPGAR